MSLGQRGQPGPQLCAAVYRCGQQPVPFDDVDDLDRDAVRECGTREGVQVVYARREAGQIAADEYGAAGETTAQTLSEDNEVRAQILGLGEVSACPAVGLDFIVNHQEPVTLCAVPQPS